MSADPSRAVVPGRSSDPPRIPDYELIRRIGQGAYGEVWLGRGVTGVLRAVKIVWRDRFADSTPYDREFHGLKQFAAISLESAGQLALLHVGQNESGGFFYYVMELADDAERGREIDPVRYVPLTLKEVRARRGRVLATECLGLAIELARALAGLHGRGLVHRDIKPSNVIFVNGAAKLADIGLVTSAGGAGTYVGTEGFVPPEGPGAPPADVFALGHLLYELATGRDHREFPKLPADLKTLPDHRTLLELNQVILRACEPERTRRYPDAAAMLKDLLALQAGQSPGRRRKSSLRRGVTIAAAAVVLFGLILAARRSARPTSEATPTPATAFLSPAAQPPADFALAKSVAVLPFTNLSPDPENAFFADGMHEDILTNLALIRDLRVVSRTSVMSYRGTTKKSPEIAGELGVTYILEGSVRRAGNKVRVTGQLIRAATDEHLWAKFYDRDLTDIFAIQAELAMEISGALETVLSPEEKNLLERKPTENLAAYDLYLKARDNRGRMVESARRRSESLYQAAVELDPGFAEAWAGLAVTHAQAIYFGRDASAAQFSKATAAIDRAVGLAPDSPEIIRCLGQYYSYVGEDDRAAEQFEKIVALQPNHANSYNFFGNIRRSQARWADALALHRKAVQLDPGDPFSAQTFSNTLIAVRQWEAALAETRRLVALSDSLRDRYRLAYRAFMARGSRREAEELIARLTPAERDSPEGIALREHWAMVSGDFAEALRLYRVQSYFGAIDTTEQESSAAAEAAAAYLALGDAEGARRTLGDYPASLRRRVEQEPNNPFAWRVLGLMQALIGQPAEALQSARKAVELNVDAMREGRFVHGVAVVLAWSGDKDGAIDELTRLLSEPSYFVTVHNLRSGPWLVSLRGDPRFEALLNDPKNNAPLF